MLNSSITSDDVHGICQHLSSHCSLHIVIPFCVFHSSSLSFSVYYSFQYIYFLYNFISFFLTSFHLCIVHLLIYLLVSISYHPFFPSHVTCLLSILYSLIDSFITSLILSFLLTNFHLLSSLIHFFLFSVSFICKIVRPSATENLKPLELKHVKFLVIRSFWI